MGKPRAGTFFTGIIAGLFLILILPIALSRSGLQDETGWEPGKPLSLDKVVIGVIHVDDATTGYSYSHAKGIRITQEKFGLADSQIINKYNINDSDPIMVDHAMRECINQGANIIIATSWGQREVSENLAALYPNVLFTNAASETTNSTNFTSYFGRMYQARYLSGIVAGLKTRSNRLGFVAAMGKDNSEVTSGINAFARGVESVNPDARVHLIVTNSWHDPYGERVATQQLLDAGCDVITQHCNTPTPLETAQMGGVWGIGFNSDMAAAAPRAIITSVIWNWEVYYIQLIQSVLDGTFTTAPYLGGFTDGMVDLTPLNPALADKKIKKAVAETKNLVRDGVIDVFDGIIRTNDGRTLGRAGSSLSDRDIIKGMNWYYHTVLE